MPVSSIAVLLIRLFACSWVIQGLAQCFPYLRGGSVMPLVFVPVTLVIAGVLFWIFSPKISRLLVKGTDENCSLEGVALLDLYSVVFVGMGLYFTLSSFAEVINWLHYFTMARHADFDPETTKTSFYGATKPAVTLAVGIFLLFTSRIWAGKLVRQAGK